MKEIELFSSMDEILIGQICAVLEENNIAFVKNEDGAGEYTSVVMGTNIFEKKILVNEENYEKAKELIEPIINMENSVETEDIPDELNEEEIREEDKINIKDSRFVLIRRLCGLYALGLPIIVIVSIIIIAIIVGL